MADISKITKMFFSKYIGRIKSAGNKSNNKSNSNNKNSNNKNNSNNKSNSNNKNKNKVNNVPWDSKRLCLRDEAADGQAWDIFLVKDVYVGRSSSCHICLGDASVSRIQCRVYYNGEAMIENLSKTNITQVNGKALNAPKALKIGDKVKCGQVALTVENSDLRDAKDLNNRTMYINI